jgi:hypothetical protein
LSIIIDNLILARENTGHAMIVRSESDKGEDGIKARRKSAMAVLAHSSAQDIAGHLGELELPAYESLREPENGLVMLRGRVGGDGAGSPAARWVSATHWVATGRRRG